ncbi:tyrosine-type recombinase/integrase [Piscinibacter aquaticus]|uniref:Tyrosine-type recombinase/integrase n=1 Tax=Piscinibacter aquaticus TaxID=392597 RepID=A0A5C6TZL9_9BURK|nr:tyrosine-type recombinase/integrase [Piscinibacter aquaticus]
MSPSANGIGRAIAIPWSASPSASRLTVSCGSPRPRGAPRPGLDRVRQPQFWPMVELALVSTMRRGSLLKLEWDKVSLATREVHVWAKGREVTLPLSQRAVQLLRSVPRNGTPYVFSMSKNAVKLAWEGVRDKADLHWLRFADLRHLGATFYARAGLNAHELRLVLGHKTTKMAEVYVNLVNTDVMEALDHAEGRRPIGRRMPPREVHAGREAGAIVAERRTARLNGELALPPNVVPSFRKGAVTADSVSPASLRVLERYSRHPIAKGVTGFNWRVVEAVAARCR